MDTLYLTDIEDDPDEELEDAHPLDEPDNCLNEFSDEESESPDPVALNNHPMQSNSRIKASATSTCQS